MADKKHSTEGDDVIASLGFLFVAIVLIAFVVGAVRFAWEILSSLFN